MPAIRNPNVVGIVTPSLVQGDLIVVTNLSRDAPRLKLNLNENKQAIVDLANTQDYEIGDSVLIEAFGKQQGGKIYTIVEGGINTDITTAASTAAGVDL